MTHAKQPLVKSQRLLIVDILLIYPFHLVDKREKNR